MPKTLGGMSSVCDISERKQLRLLLRNLACVRAMSFVARKKLGRELDAAISKYRALSSANKERRSAPGNKTKLHVQALLYDCSRAWGEIMGESEVLMWEATEPRKESPVAELARACLTVAEGKSYRQSLRQQFIGTKALLALNK